MLYLIFTLGGVGLYFLLPNPGRSKTVAGAILGLSALAALLVLLIVRVTPGATTGYFYLFAAIALIAAVRVITHPRPVYSAVYFVLVVVAVAALLVLQGAEFLAIALIIIYAGAILVTYLFVIMLAQPTGSPAYDRRAREPFFTVLVGFILMGAVAGKAGDLPAGTQPPTVPVSSAESVAGWPDGNTAAVGQDVMTKYVTALEIAGVLLLISMVGAIALARKRVPSEEVAPPERPLGEVGKEVAPF
jgi:NADH-quinone oxidoreductase subunit J